MHQMHQYMNRPEYMQHFNPESPFSDPCMPEFSRVGDIAANTIDFIWVKDDGHGIPNEDRALAYHRYCTSTIRDYSDLKEVGGKWLGFRGEALASVADMSGTLCITTRVEGEPVAVKLTYQRNGELTTWVLSSQG
jgi:DNA mismatch repair ATPase MutL